MTILNLDWAKTKPFRGKHGDMYQTIGDNYSKTLPYELNPNSLEISEMILLLNFVTFLESDLDKDLTEFSTKFKHA